MAVAQVAVVQARAVLALDLVLLDLVVVALAQADHAAETVVDHAAAVDLEVVVAAAAVRDPSAAAVAVLNAVDLLAEKDKENLQLLSR